VTHSLLNRLYCSSAF